MGVKYITVDGNIWKDYEEKDIERVKENWRIKANDRLVKVHSNGYGDERYAYIQKRNIVAIYSEL